MYIVSMHGMIKFCSTLRGFPRLGALDIPREPSKIVLFQYLFCFKGKSMRLFCMELCYLS